MVGFSRSTAGSRHLWSSLRRGAEAPPGLATQVQEPPDAVMTENSFPLHIFGCTILQPSSFLLK